ncbi:MAG: hypothetical protein M3550_03085 [Actinomycetota bacterium]|nr:hypothetical protein [Actinomycetota bacterium]
MAISRPFLLAVLGAALLAATFLSVQNARNNASSDAVPAAQEAPPPADAPAAQAKPATSPVDTLKSSLSGKLTSAAFDLQVTLSGGAEKAKVGLSGAFERGAANDVPALDLNANVDAGGQSFEGGFVAVDEKAYFTQGDKAWQVPAEAWDPVVAAVADGTGAQAQPLPVNLNPETWVRDAKTVGQERLDGVDTTHVSASVDVEAMARDLTQSVPGSAAQLPRAGQIAGLVERAELDAWVGSDQILRRLTARLSFDSGREGRGSADLALDLTGVNRAQNIEAPAKVRAGLPGGQFGTFVQGFTTGLSGLTGAEPLSLAALSTENPRKAARAVRSHRKVLIFFRNPRGLDDRAVGRSVRAVQSTSNAVVLTDHVDAVERYGKLVEDLGVSQTPSLVLIDSTGEARLIEGFIDSNSLTQAVADAR